MRRERGLDGQTAGEQRRSMGRGRRGRAGRSAGKWVLENGRDGRKRACPPNVKHLTGDDKSNGNYCGKNIIRNLIEVKQNLHNTAN